MRSRRTRIPNFDRPVLKASLEKRLGLVNVLATILAIALATVPDGDALNLTCALELFEQSAAAIAIVIGSRAAAISFALVHAGST